MRNYCVLLSWAAWIWLLGSCQGLRYVVERGNLEVMSPESLQGFYDSSIGRFGIPEHGGALAGVVVYPRANRKACSPFDRFDMSFRSRVGSLPVILLADRGDCFFATKVYNAQKTGAAAVLIVDSIFEPLITMETPEETIGSNYFQRKVDIPSALISKSFGEKIKEALTRGDGVTISLVFNSPNQLALPPPEQVKYDLWISGHLGCGAKCEDQLEFVQNFREVAKVLEERGYTQFTPHYVLWHCPEAFILSRQCRSQCINHGRYCAPYPLEGNFHAGCQNEINGMVQTGCSTGRDVVVQSLVQACFYKVAKESGKPWLWWDYVNDFARQCSMRSGMYPTSCRDRIIRRLGVDRNKVYECVGETEADQEHPLLKAEQDARFGGLGHGKDVNVVPTLVINNNYYRGKLVKDDVLKAICAAIREEVRPDICPKVDMERVPKGIRSLSREEGLQEILLPLVLDERAQVINVKGKAGLELGGHEEKGESTSTEGRRRVVQPTRYIPWSWIPSRSEAPRPEILDDESGSEKVKEADEIISKEVGFEEDVHETGSNVTEGWFKEPESTTKYILGTWNLSEYAAAE